MAVQAQRFLSSRTRWIVFGLLIAISVYLLAVAPMRTYLSQRDSRHTAEQRYGLLASANKQLDTRVNQLQTDAEIQRLARDQYELVQPGEQAFAVMPAPVAAAPAAPAKKHNKGLWSRAWDDITFWY
jgi:cell division protein FtsB